MARDRFGFLERHGFVNCSVGALQHLTLGRRSTPRVQTNCVKCDVVDSELRFNCVSTRPKAGQMVRLLLRLLQEARQCFARTFVRRERTIRTAGCGDVEKQSCLRRYKWCPACERNLRGRALDREIRTPPVAGTERTQETTGGS